MSTPLFRAAPLAAAALMAVCGLATASSHREAPFITTAPKVDGTDFYMFRSYEPGRDGYVTLLANYQPLQDAYGGPNYFKMDPNALYEIHIDNNGDANEDITFQFRFQNKLANGGNGATLTIGEKNIAIPQTQTVGTVTQVADPHLNVLQTYTLDVVRGGRRSGNSSPALKKADGGRSFDMPVDNIGTKTLPDYAGYAAKFIHEVTLPNCSMPARVFVGQRQDAFAINLGVFFDQLNAPVSFITDPTMIGAATNTLDDKNVTTLALEVHKSCLTNGDDVIGGWTTASLRQARVLDGTPAAGLQTSEKVGGPWVQVSRLGMPLVNEVVIGLKDKDRFNASKPKDDAQFLDYVTHPTLPAVLAAELNLPGAAPTNIQIGRAHV